MQPPATVKIRDARGDFIRHEINLDAENLRWLASDYYLDQLDGNQADWINNRLGNETVLVVDGSPVWPMFRRDFHVAREPLRPVPGREVMVWLDFGRVFPAVLFAQEINGPINVQHEMLGFNEGATIFAPKVKRFLEQHYAGCDFRCVGDPKGRDKGQATEQSAYDVFKHNGMPVTPAPVKANDIATRLEAVAYAKTRKTFDAPLAEHQTIRNYLAESAIDLYSGRTMALDCAERIDNGADGRSEVSMVKVYTTQVAFKVIDRAMQIHGGMGLANETELHDAWMNTRMTRITEGSNEIQMRSIAAYLLSGRIDLGFV